jgi:citrate lyase subunit beta/citryl-CoA lyase
MTDAYRDLSHRSARPRRVCLVVPANSVGKMAKAATLDVDEVILDLEDSVPDGEKGDRTRQRAIDAMRSLTWVAPLVAVRVNEIESEWFRDDVAAIVNGAGPRLGSMVLPKVERPEQVVEAAELLDRLFSGGTSTDGVGLEALVETARGVVNVERVAASSQRLETLIFGAGDFASSMGLPIAAIGAVDPTYPGDQWAYPRARIAVAARACGLEPIDGPFASFRDEEGLAESARRARALGFAGKWVVHPSQIAPCLFVFTPSPEEQAMAERVEKALDGAASRGIGAVEFEGAMVDAATGRAVKRLRAQRP